MQAGGDPLRPKAHKKGLPGLFCPAALAAVGVIVWLLCLHSSTDHLVIWKERVMGAA